jgi:hypothetical protein
MLVGKGKDVHVRVQLLLLNLINKEGGREGRKEENNERKRRKTCMYNASC